MLSAALKGTALACARSFQSTARGRPVARQPQAGASAMPTRRPPPPALFITRWPLPPLLIRWLPSPCPRAFWRTPSGCRQAAPRRPPSWWAQTRRHAWQSPLASPAPAGSACSQPFPKVRGWAGCWGGGEGRSAACPRLSAGGRAASWSSAHPTRRRQQRWKRPHTPPAVAPLRQQSPHPAGSPKQHVARVGHLPLPRLKAAVGQAAQEVSGGAARHAAPAVKSEGGAHGGAAPAEYRLRLCGEGRAQRGTERQGWVRQGAGAAGRRWRVA